VDYVVLLHPYNLNDHQTNLCTQHLILTTKQTYRSKTMIIKVIEHLTDEEFHQIMEIVGTALDRSRDKGFINGDTDVLELSIKAHIPEN